MAGRFNPDDYASVAERLQKFWAEYPEGRIITQIVNTPKRPEDGDWLVQAILYTGSEPTDLPRATGAAKQTYAEGVEVCETSAVGRALAIFNYAGNRKLGTLASREEMEQFQKADTWTEKIDGLSNVEDARQLYNEARTRKAPPETLEAIKSKVASFAPPTKG